MTNFSIFVDTGPWYAMMDKNDQYHSKASNYFKQLLKKKICDIYTSNIIIQETVTLVARRINKKISIKFLNTIFNDPKINVLYIDANIEQKAYDTFKNYLDQQFSIVDCTSFILMQHHHIKHAFTFDKHFRTMQFTVRP